jgi:hypothetical protein
MGHWYSSAVENCLNYTPSFSYYQTSMEQIDRKQRVVVFGSWGNFNVVKIGGATQTATHWRCRNGD